MVVQDPGVKTGLFLGGEGIGHAADGIHLLGNVQGGPFAGALEDHVFDEMGDPVFLGVFIPGAVIHPDAHRDRIQIRQGLGDDPKSIRQYGFVDHGHHLGGRL